MQCKEQVGSFRISVAVMVTLGAGSRPILASKLSTKVTASILTVGEGGFEMGWLARCLGQKLGWYTVKTEVIEHGARTSRICPSGLGGNTLREDPLSALTWNTDITRRGNPNVLAW